MVDAPQRTTQNAPPKLARLPPPTPHTPHSTHTSHTPPQPHSSGGGPAAGARPGACQRGCYRRVHSHVTRTRLATRAGRAEVQRRCSLRRGRHEKAWKEHAGMIVPGLVPTCGQDEAATSRRDGRCARLAAMRGLRWGWGGHSPVGAGQSGRGEEGAAGAALAAVKTGARTSPGAGDRSGWVSAAAMALERLPGIAIGLWVGLPPCNRTLLCNRKRNYVQLSNPQ